MEETSPSQIAWWWLNKTAETCCRKTNERPVLKELCLDNESLLINWQNGMVLSTFVFTFDKQANLSQQEQR
jgi:hypothetical protein